MELEHSFTVPVPEERAWNVLMDVERVAPCMPGATLTSVDGDVISGNIKVKVGPIAMTYAGTARFTERDPDQHVITLEASGKETRGAGTASAKVRSSLSGQGDQTHVTVHTTLNVTGRPAQFGRGVMAEVGGKLIGIFAANLAEMLAADTGSEGPAPGGTASTDPASAGTAVDGEDDAAEPPQGNLSAPLDELGLPQRSCLSLTRAGIRTVGELAARTGPELLALDGIGPASVQEISQRLADRGLALAEAQPAAASTARPSTAQPSTAHPGAGQPGTAAEATGADGTGADGAGAPAPVTTAPAGAAPAPWHAGPDDAIDLLSVAGLPVLKRAIPVLAGLAAAALVALRVRYRRRHPRG
jgi:carbon monoxide dehydrogenase subunit G